MGRIDPCAHQRPELLGSRARGQSYDIWLAGFTREQAASREDFVVHHNERYGGTLPVWAAVEIMDWGKLTYLFGFAPDKTRSAVADACELSAPQVESWLKALNLMRNTSAHHGRLFNRVHTFVPRLPAAGRHPDFDSATSAWNRTFGQLTLVQFLLDRLGVGRPALLPAVIRSYPTVRSVPLHHIGAPLDWAERSSLWGS